ncbi:GNAT family N-acetyltransferase [Leisingera sp.]|uniref:GNAT family N-acetyltransferase n=1 Tax=Leisingera sp. TaxID=1879318 RepID=UPI002B26E938|nr:GNAT family N-acetyltransferase [Leisingera sp.]
MTVAIPTLETDRLILRAPAQADFTALCAFYASERADFVGGQMDAEQVWRHLALEIGHWQMLGYGRWAVDEKSSGQCAGIIGLWNPHGWPEAEIGWDLFQGFSGKGYATEAAIAARNYAYVTLGWPTAISLVDPANHASAAVAQRMGAKQDGSFAHPRMGKLQIWRHQGADDLAAGGMEACA